jgi:vacuolar-type H+-ATPase subunit F/Vma7
LAAIPEENHGTRMLFLGDDSLADGFRLIGFETFPNPQPGDVDKLFRDLLKAGDKAFVIVDDELMRAEVPSLQQVRAEGGRIVVASVPRLREPSRLASDVADRLDAMFGRGAAVGQD